MIFEKLKDIVLYLSLVKKRYFFEISIVHIAVYLAFADFWQYSFRCFKHCGICDRNGLLRGRKLRRLLLRSL